MTPSLGFEVVPRVSPCLVLLYPHTNLRLFQWRCEIRSCSHWNKELFHSKGIPSRFHVSSSTTQRFICDWTKEWVTPSLSPFPSLPFPPSSLDSSFQCMVRWIRVWICRWNHVDMERIWWMNSGRIDTEWEHPDRQVEQRARYRLRGKDWLVMSIYSSMEIHCFFRIEERDDQYMITLIWCILNMG